MAATVLAGAGVHAVAAEQATPVRRSSWPMPLPRFTPRRAHAGPARFDRSPAGLERMAAADAKRARRGLRNVLNVRGFYRVDPVVLP